MKLIIRILFAIILILNTGCATIFIGSQETIRVKSNLKTVNLKLNQIGTNVSADSIVVSKKYKKPILEVSQENYETQKFQLTLAPRPGITGLNNARLIIGSIGVVTGVALSTAVKSSGSKTQSGIGVPIALASAAVLLVPAIVDMALKSTHSFTYKDLEFDMIPIPKKVEPAFVETIACSTINFKIQAGKQIGATHKSKGGEFVEDKKITWQETSNVSVNEIQVEVNNTFDKFGYSVPGLKDKFQQENISSRYLINAEVLDIKYDNYIHGDYTRVPNLDKIVI